MAVTAPDCWARMQGSKNLFEQLTNGVRQFLKLTGHVVLDHVAVNADTLRCEQWQTFMSKASVERARREYEHTIVSVADTWVGGGGGLCPTKVLCMCVIIQLITC
jgi:hypothetical protein